MNSIVRDYMAWVWVGKVLAIVALGLLARYFFEKGIKELNPKIKKTYFRKGWITCTVLVLTTLALFVFFGAGKTPMDVTVEEDGHRQLVEARPEAPPESTIKEEAKAKRDPYLNAVDASPAAAQKESEEYINNALNRANQRNEKGAKK